MKRIPKDLLREQIVKNAPAAPPGMKKHYDPETRSVRYVPKTAREDWEEIQRRKDGITMDTAGLSEPLRFIVRVLPPSDRAAMQKGWVDATRDRHVATAAAFGLIAVHDRTETAQRLVAGRFFQRIHLAVTARGLALQPLNQVPERVDREMSAGLDPIFTSSMAGLTAPGLDVVMAFRVGRPTTTPNLSPRRPVDDVLIAS